MTICTFGDQAISVISLTPAFNFHKNILRIISRTLDDPEDVSLEYWISLAINHLSLNPNYDA